MLLRSAVAARLAARYATRKCGEEFRKGMDKANGKHAERSRSTYRSMTCVCREVKRILYIISVDRSKSGKEFVCVSICK